MIMKVNLSINPTKPDKVDILYFKSVKGQAKFKINTSETNIFTKCFSNSNLVMKHIAQLRQKLDKVKKTSAADSLINKESYWFGRFVLVGLFW